VTSATRSKNLRIKQVGKTNGWVKISDVGGGYFETAVICRLWRIKKGGVLDLSMVHSGSMRERNLSPRGVNCGAHAFSRSLRRERRCTLFRFTRDWKGSWVQKKRIDFKAGRRNKGGMVCEGKQPKGFKNWREASRESK